jgi:8-oxo-dGTP pyrophosphatase MutT (NUDIX family)
MIPETLARCLSARSRASLTGPGRAAAVLIPLFERDGEVFVVLIKRSETLQHHRGQYALPGGTRDPRDATIVDTALRESLEEVGIRPADVRVLGLLDDRATGTGFVITPVVGWIPPAYTFVTDASEVAFVLELPLHHFLAPPRADMVRLEGRREQVVYSFEVNGHLIWGATARILLDLSEVVRSADLSWSNRAG